MYNAFYPFSFLTWPYDVSVGLGVERGEPDDHLRLLVLFQLAGPLLDPARLDHGLGLDPGVQGVDPTQKSFLSWSVNLK